MFAGGTIYLITPFGILKRYSIFIHLIAKVLRMESFNTYVLILCVCVCVYYIEVALALQRDTTVTIASNSKLILKCTQQ